MNRTQYYRLRHNMRASGWSWNGGSRLTIEDDFKRQTGIGRSMSVGEAKTPEIALVGKTLPTLYDKPKEMDYDNENSGLYMPLYREWAQAKKIGLNNRTRISWKNFIRSNVRNDRAIFSEQLTSW